MWQVGASAGAAPSNRTGHLPTLGHASLRWGVRWSRATSLRMRSAVEIEDQGPDSLTGMVTGRHEVHARLGVGPDRKKGLRGDVIARGRFHHLGQTRRALGPVDIGAGAHTEAALSLGVAPHLSDKASGTDASGFTVPVTTTLRRIDYLGLDAPVSRAFTRTVAVGIGARMVDRHAVDLLIQLLGLSHARTELEARQAARDPGAAGPDGMNDGSAPAAAVLEPGMITQTTLRMAELDLAIYNRSIVVAATGHTGWTWLRDSHDHRRVNLLVMQYGFKLRGEGKGAGLGFGRSGSHTADGRRFVAEYRVEAHAEWQDEHVGVLLRALTSWLTDKEREGDEDPGVLGRHALSGEMFYRLPGGVQMGAYGMAAHQPEAKGAPLAETWDPWQRARGWDVEMGGFVRWVADD
jgi:hypothetical protein